MKKLITKINGVAAAFLFVAATTFTSCTNTGRDISNLQSKIDSLEKELKSFTDDKAVTKMRLAIFDTLDFDVYTNQRWNRVKESHGENIIVYYPDASTTQGLPDHIVEMQKMFTFAPDTRVVAHPVAFGTGEWTAAISVVEGTFTKPMPIGDEKFNQPNGKAFKYNVLTVGRWNKDNLITEEYLFWDNLDFMKQIGLTK